MDCKICQARFVSLGLLLLGELINLTSCRKCRARVLMNSLLCLFLLLSLTTALASRQTNVPEPVTFEQDPLGFFAQEERAKQEKLLAEQRKQQKLDEEAKKKDIAAGNDPLPDFPIAEPEPESKPLNKTQVPIKAVAEVSRVSVEAAKKPADDEPVDLEKHPEMICKVPAKDAALYLIPKICGSLAAVFSGIAVAALLTPVIGPIGAGIAGTLITALAAPVAQREAKKLQEWFLGLVRKWSDQRKANQEEEARKLKAIEASTK